MHRDAHSQVSTTGNCVLPPHPHRCCILGWQRRMVAPPPPPGSPIVPAPPQGTQMGRRDGKRQAAEMGPEPTPPARSRLEFQYKQQRVAPRRDGPAGSIPSNLSPAPSPSVSPPRASPALGLPAPHGSSRCSLPMFDCPKGGCLSFPRPQPASPAGQTKRVNGRLSRTNPITPPQLWGLCSGVCVIIAMLPPHTPILCSPLPRGAGPLHPSGHGPQRAHPWGEGTTPAPASSPSRTPTAAAPCRVPKCTSSGPRAVNWK